MEHTGAASLRVHGRPGRRRDGGEHGDAEQGNRGDPHTSHCRQVLRFVRTTRPQGPDGQNAGRDAGILRKGGGCDRRARVAAPPRAGTGGATVALPPGWHSIAPDQGSITSPLTRIVVSSGLIHSDLTSACQTQVAAYTFPQTAVAIVVVEWTRQIGGMKIGVGRHRPRHFTAVNLPIHRPPIIECYYGPGGSTQWAERGHTFAAYVLLGRKAPAALAVRARAVLDTLRVSRR